MEEKIAELKKKMRSLFSDKKAQEFVISYVLKWLEKAEEDGVIRIAHVTGGKNADPDARSSAEAIAVHLDHLASIYVSETGKEVQFEHDVFGDGMNEPENVLFLSECQLKMSPLSELHAERYHYFLGYETSETGEKIPRFDAVWNHHDKLPESKDTFTDIRSILNATAMIVSFYVSPFLDRTNHRHRLLATALRYGIITDLESSGEHEYSTEEEEIEKGLDEFADHTVLDRIRGQKLLQTDYWLEIFPQVKTIIFGSFAIQGLGFIKASQERYVRVLVNDLIRTKGISTALSFGIVDGEMAIYKTRADDDSPITLRKIDELLMGRKDDDLSHGKKSDSRLRAGGGDIRLCPTFREEKVEEGDNEETKERKEERPRKYYRNVFDNIVEWLTPVLPSSTQK